MKGLRVIFVVAIMALSTALSAQVRVACVGNSITFGSGIENREQNSYPAQLQELLGEGYEVRNFGVSGATLLSKGNKPYIETSAYKPSLEFEPNIVLIKLGTNDSKPFNMVYINEFIADYQSLVDSYKALATKPRIILVTPVKCYLSSDKPINDERMRESITPAINKIAKDNGLEIINGYALCGTTLDLEIMPDMLHPSAKGAAMMAQYFSQFITK